MIDLSCTRHTRAGGRRSSAIYDQIELAMQRYGDLLEAALSRCRKMSSKYDDLRLSDCKRKVDYIKSILNNQSCQQCAADRVLSQLATLSVIYGGAKAGMMDELEHNAASRVHEMMQQNDVNPDPEKLARYDMVADRILVDQDALVAEAGCLLHTEFISR